jgi:hypothetical protein
MRYIKTVEYERNQSEEAVKTLCARVAELEAQIAQRDALATLDDCIHMDHLEAVNKAQGANLRRYREALEDIGDQGGTFGSGKLPSAYDKGCRARKALEGQR